MNENEYALKYNLDLNQTDVVIIYHPEEKVKEFLVYFPDKQKVEVENQVSDFVSILPKSEFEFVSKIFTSAQIYTAKKSVEVISTFVDENKEKYLDVEVVLKDDKFVLVAKHGGWSYINTANMTLGEYCEFEKKQKERMKRLEAEREKKEKIEALERERIAVETGQGIIEEDPRFKRYQRLIRFAENLTLKDDTKEETFENNEFEK